MSEQFIETEIEKEVEDVEVIQRPSDAYTASGGCPKKKQLSLKQLEHLNNIRIKALEKKREIKLKKNKEYENKINVEKAEVIEEPIKQPEPKQVPWLRFLPIFRKSGNMFRDFRNFGKPSEIFGNLGRI